MFVTNAKYKLTAFMRFLLDRGASRATAYQYVGKIRALLVAVEDETGTPQWRDFERVKAHYYTLSYGAQSQLGAAWNYFLAFQTVRLPPLSKPRGRVPGRVVETEAPPVDPVQVKGLDRAAAMLQFLRDGLVAEGDTSPVTTLAELYWDRSAAEPDRWFVRTDLGPHLWARRFEPVLDAYREIFYPAGLRECALLLPKKAGSKEPMALDVIRERLARDVPSEIRAIFDQAAAEHERVKPPLSVPVLDDAAAVATL